MAFVEEHTSLTFLAGQQGVLLVNGCLLPWASAAPISPFIEKWERGKVTINVHDWVGRLHLTSSDGFLNEEVYVYPSKLADDSKEAFTALSRMVDSLPDAAAILGFPTELVPAADGLHQRQLTLQDIEQVALKARQLTLDWHRRPRWREGTQRRVVRGGIVPDRVDWPLTLEEWGHGRFPDHVARVLPQAVLPGGLNALRRLWEALVNMMEQSPGGTRLSQGARQVLHGLPAQRASDDGRDAISRQARELLEHLETGRRQSRNLPTGHARMAELYEFWVQVSVLKALEAKDGHFEPNSQGLYVGTFRGPGVTVTLNPRLSFYGVGQGQQYLMPDLLVEFDTGQTLVADVKYRPLNRLPTEQIREVNRQMLTYMGLTHAATGVVLWPAMTGEAMREEPLPSGRARLLRMRCHPLDPPGELSQRLRHLSSIGVP